jgi:hypothetical protein
MRSADKSGQLPAPIGLFVRLAYLARFWRINSEQPDALAADLDGVAVDYGRLPNQLNRIGLNRPGKRRCKCENDDPTHRAAEVAQSSSEGNVRTGAGFRYRPQGAYLATLHVCARAVRETGAVLTV